MKILYTDFITHTRVEIDLSESREACALKLANAYCEQNQKKKTTQVILSFSRSSGIYHRVRSFIEDLKADNFTEILTKFKELHPQLSPDWQDALKCGLIVKAGARVGNFSNNPHIYNNPFAIALRAAGMSGAGPLIKEILIS